MSSVLQAAKICNNMLLAIGMIGTAETMNLGIRYTWCVFVCVGSDLGWEGCRGVSPAPLQTCHWWSETDEGAETLIYIP